MFFIGHDHDWLVSLYTPHWRHTHTHRQTDRQTEYVYIAVGNMYILATVVDAN